MEQTDVLVIGAGQAGLSAAYHLGRTATRYLAVDGEPRPGGAWQHRWPSLTMATVNGIRELPDSQLPQDDPERPAREAIPSYFADYEAKFGLAVRRPVVVTSVVGRVHRGDELLTATTTDGRQVAARALINATGTWNRPFWPTYPGRATFAGKQWHTKDYPGAGAFAGKRVVVIGGGISAIQFLQEIAPVAAAHRWVTRRPPVWVEREFTSELGRTAVAMVEERVRRGLPPKSVVSVTGLPLTPAIRSARESGVLQRFAIFDAIDARGISWADGSRFDADILLWCTGFRAALDHLAPLRLRGRHGGIVMDGTRTVVDPRVHLVGYGPSASTVGANRAGRAAVQEIRGLLGLAEGPGRGLGRHAVVG